jgi:hypothetical protein
MALITITDVIKSCIDDFPTAGGTLTFLLSGWLTNSTGKIILPSPETCSVSNVDGTFSIALESTTDATPGTRTYSVIFSGSVDGSPISLNLGSFGLNPSPGSQDLSDLLNVGAIAGNGLSLGTLSLGATEPRLIFVETDQGSNLKNWDIDINAGVFSLRTRTDADGAGTTFMSVVRGATTAVASISFLNANVGIGTSSPGAALAIGSGSVQNGSTTQALFSPTRWDFQQTGGDNANAGNIDYRGFDANALSIVGAGTSSSNRLIHFYDGVGINAAPGMNQTLLADGTGHTYTAIFTGGNVGIGLTTPGATLQVTGTVAATPVVVGVVGASATITVTSGVVYTLTSTASTAMTLTPSAAGVAGQEMELIITSDATGGDVVTFASTFKSTGTLTLTANKIYVVRFRSNGTNWLEQSRTTGV